MKYVEVVIDRVSRSLDRTFTYEVPDAIRAQCDQLIGQVVAVSFNHRISGAYVVGELNDAADIDGIKPVLGIVAGPYFDKDDVAVARNIANHYVCTLVEAIGLFVPFATCPNVIDEGQGNYSLKAAAGRAKYEEVAALTKGACAEMLSARASGQRRVFEMLKGGPRYTSELRKAYPQYRTALRGLVEQDLVTLSKQRIFRNPSSSEVAFATVPDTPKQLNEEQLSALETIVGLRGAQVCVLEGITGSGKTEVYLQAIESILRSGLDGIVLVPEIALTPQAVRRFTARFGDIVAVLHSRMSTGEQLDEHDRIRSGQARVVVGPRSALFAINSRTGIIIIDEEHDGSYKQSSSPRYHARTVALMIGEQRNIPVVLGSATPSMGTRKAVQDKTWKLARLTRRATGATVPPVEVVDLVNEFELGNKTMFSAPLTQALQEVRRRGEKAILLLNRRGFANFLLCRECGHVPTCPHCSTSLTFHASHNHLRCHQCNLIVASYAQCPQCSSSYLRMLGAGTQRVEMEMEQLFPDWPVIRMDADTTAAKNGHQHVLDSFEALDSGVLLGTQMISKGLDYHDVTLVGVLTADITMNFPDYMAGERTYQLLEQVSGRAGRGDKPGCVIIQSYNPDHPALRAIEEHNPDLFYIPEDIQRQSLGYPPHRRLINIVVSSPTRNAAESSCYELTQTLSDYVAERHLEPSVQIIGPSVCVLERIQNRYRYHVVVRSSLDFDSSSLVKEALDTRPTADDVRIIVDVDPETLM